MGGQSVVTKMDVDGLGAPVPNTSLSYKFRTVDLEHLTAPENQERLSLLDFFIRSQAALHHAEYHGNPFLLKDSIERRGNTFRGVVIYSGDRLPMAYAVYYPMINATGERGNYIEDAFVTESFRGRGVMPIVFHELAKRCLDEGALYLQWSTDRRNAPFHRFSQKIGATHPNVATYVTSGMLDDRYQPPSELKQAWDSTRYVTIPIAATHINKMKSLGITPDILRKTGDIDFKGFVTFRADDMTCPVAVTPGWPHMSTFTQRHGIYLEQPSFSDEVVRADEQDQIMCSLAKAAQRYAKENDFQYFKWHLTPNTFAGNLIADKMAFSVDTMVETPQSEMLVYNLKNGRLTALASQDDVTVVHVPTDAGIGTPRTPAPTAAA